MALQLAQEGPTFFYKYQPISLYSLRNLQEDQLWLSKPSAFNDPFEFKFEILNPTARGATGIPNLLTRVDDFGVACLATHPELIRNYTQDDTDLHPDNMLMWSHYANSHTGFVLGLRKKNAIFRVNYDDNFPQVDLSLTDNEVMIQMFFAIHQKQTCWSYEHEFRVILVDRNSQPLMCHNAFEIERIYFGVSTEESDINLVKNITAGRNILYYKAKLMPNRFEIEFDPI